MKRAARRAVTHAGGSRWRGRAIGTAARRIACRSGAAVAQTARTSDAGAEAEAEAEAEAV
ncbi:hypothetical protein SZ31_18965 [Burkholderia pseudomallei]|nr:hypothetical protein SZ31_18965 [Burkholderia pseudomallei]